jgi:serine/threonine-protein kinase
VPRRPPSLTVAMHATAVVALALVLLGCGEAGTEVDRWELRVGDQGASETVDLPRHLPIPDRPCTYVLSSRFEVPEQDRGAPLTLVLQHLYASASVRANGRDTIAIDPESTARYRSSGMQRFVLPPEITSHGAIDLEIVVDHRWTQSAWFDVAPRIALGAAGDARFRVVRGLNDGFAIAGISASLVCGFVYVLVFAFDRRRRAEGWFALESTLAAVYAAFNLGVLQGLVGVYDAPLTNLGLAGSAIAAVHFTHAQLHLGPPHRAWRWAAAFSLVSVLVVGGPFTDTGGAARVTMSIMTANCIVQTWYFIKFVRAKPRPMGLALVTLTWPISCLLALPDFCAWLGFGEILGGLRGAPLGVAFVSFSGFLAMSRDLVGTNRRIDQLNAELSRRVSLLETKHQEVHDLNDELRRQISVRSANLADMLATASAPGEATSGALPLGEVLHDRYRIVRAIGAGGMGVVYEAERTKDGRRFALKVLNGRTSRTALARFAREAQIVSQIDHENVVSIADVDVSPAGVMFIVMELVDGRSLDDQRDRWGDVPWALDVLAQVAEGLAAIHGLGIVHRDLKPGNILTRTKGGGMLAKIADFGIACLEVTQAARSARSSPESPTVREGMPPSPMSDPLTETGVMVGTPRYMAPELVTGGKNARAASDVFSFGVLAFQLLTNKYPFDVAPSIAVTPSSEKRRSIGEEVALDVRVADVLDRCLVHDHATRPSARDLADALRAPASTAEIDLVKRSLLR